MKHGGILKRRISSIPEKMLQWLAKYNWRVVGAILLFLVILEIFEILQKGEPFTDPYHATELVVYMAVFVTVGILLNFLKKANAAQDHALGILNHKYHIIEELTKLDHWDKLTNELARIPSTIAAVEASRVAVPNPISGQLEAIACWNVEGSNDSDFNQDCQKCLSERKESEFLFQPCHQGLALSDPTVYSQEYCLPINYSNKLLALIQFKLNPGEDLSPNQKDIFENIRPDMAMVLKASQDQKKLADMRHAETALAERHSISMYLHDNLSQNLAYLCLKLDQFAASDDQLFEEGWIDLQRMKDAANLSYEIVRGMIETIHPATTPHLANLIRAYANKISQQTHIEISISQSGMEVPILPEIQQTIFYVFQEALSNVEKHARAENVNIVVGWEEDKLTVTVEDDGIGFEPEHIDRSKHFGLEIMQERIDKVNGRIDFQSSPDSGTKVTLFVPVVSPKEEGVR